jgi:hypothetical protein
LAENIELNKNFSKTSNEKLLVAITKLDTTAKIVNTKESKENFVNLLNRFNVFSCMETIEKIE